MDAHGYPINSAEALRMLRETAAQITAESAQETISATAPGGAQQAFTSVTWDSTSTPPDVNTNPYFADLRDTGASFLSPTFAEEQEALRRASPKKLPKRAGGHEDAAQVRRSPCFHAVLWAMALNPYVAVSRNFYIAAVFNYSGAMV